MTEFVGYKNPNSPATWRQINKAAWNLSKLEKNYNYYHLRNFLISLTFKKDGSPVENAMSKSEIHLLINATSIPMSFSQKLNTFVLSLKPIKIKVPKKRGRPKGSKNKSSKSPSKYMLSKQTIVSEEHRETRGRPKGSKNKKPLTLEIQNKPGTPIRKFVVEKDVPLPETWRSFIEKMEVGDSVGNLTYTEIESVRKIASRLGRKAETHKEIRDGKKRAGKYRIWIMK